MKNKRHQIGLTIIELLVGLSIGLITIGAGMVAIIASRNITSTVGDVASLQQQASYAFRVMGQQIRQAGGLTLEDASDNDYYYLEDAFFRSSSITPIDGTQTTLNIMYHDDGVSRNCIGNVTGGTNITSHFKLNGSQLSCGADTNNTQPIISNVKKFQVTYLIQKQNGGTNQKFQYLDEITDTADKNRIYAVEVCLELEGTETIDTQGTKYTGCDGVKDGTDRGNRLAMVFRNTFFIPNHL